MTYDYRTKSGAAASRTFIWVFCPLCCPLTLLPELILSCSQIKTIRKLPDMRVFINNLAALQFFKKETPFWSALGHKTFF